MLGIIRDCASKYDVIIVGVGHNGLTCAADLAKAGLRVFVAESRELVRSFRYYAVSMKRKRKNFSAIFLGSKSILSIDLQPTRPYISRCRATALLCT